MTFEEIRSKPSFLSFTWALFLHLLFIAFAMWFAMPGILEDASKNMDRLRFNVRRVDMRPIFQQQRGMVSPPQSANAVKFAQPRSEISVSSPKDVSVESLVNKEAVVHQNAEEVPQKKIDLEDASANEGLNLEAVLAKTQERRLKDRVPSSQKSTASSSSSDKMLRKHTLPAEEVAGFLKQPLQGLGFGDPGNVAIDPEEGMPGFTPHSGSVGSVAADQGLQESRGELLKYDSLDDFLDIEVFTYTDLSDSQKYYMIKIFARRDIQSFKVMPKEILFTIDSSLSISPDRLDQFKKGIRYALTHLNEGDVFNAVSFKDKVTFFSKESIVATPATIKRAEAFVAGLVSSEQTDVYAAFSKIVESPLGRRPSNIILISDGRPTHGIVDSRELINSITRVNQRVRPIFAFSGGAKVNRYLLDFISYQNRAWSQFIKRTGDIQKGLAQFYDKIKDPILLDLRYRLNNLKEEEVFPKSLPDFYRNAEFTLYGRYDTEDEFSMQLLGDVEGQTKELIFSRSLKAAPAGSADIMRGYAFNKIYYLISQMTSRGDDPALLKEIHELSRRYNITTPYSPELEKTD